jgi:hypothetical protein
MTHPGVEHYNNNPVCITVVKLDYLLVKNQVGFFYQFDVYYKNFWG